jgi:hypothetical protein
LMGRGIGVAVLGEGRNGGSPERRNGGTKDGGRPERRNGGTKDGGTRKPRGGSEARRRVGRIDALLSGPRFLSVL